MLVFGVAAAALLAGLCLVLVRRWRGSGTVQRAALTPVLATGALTAATGVATLVAEASGLDGIARVLDVALLVFVTAVPFAFLTGLLRSRLSRPRRPGEERERRRGDKREQATSAAHDPVQPGGLRDQGRRAGRAVCGASPAPGVRAARYGARPAPARPAPSRARRQRRGTVAEHEHQRVGGRRAVPQQQVVRRGSPRSRVPLRVPSGTAAGCARSPSEPHQPALEPACDAAGGNATSRCSDAPIPAATRRRRRSRPRRARLAERAEEQREADEHCDRPGRCRAVHTASGPAPMNPQPSVSASTMNGFVVSSSS